MCVVCFIVCLLLLCVFVNVRLRVLCVFLFDVVFFFGGECCVGFVVVCVRMCMFVMC